MEKALIRYKLSAPLKLDIANLDAGIEQLLEYLHQHLAQAKLICVDSFTNIERQIPMDDLDAEGGAFCFVEIISQLDQDYVAHFKQKASEITEYLVTILQKDSVSITDVYHKNDDRYIIITSHLQLPL